MSDKKDAILIELRRLAKRNGGFVRPSAVVEAAADAKSPLHGEFTWNNRKAADEYRLWQARELIAQYWVVEPASRQPVRMMLSLATDRAPDAGYRFSSDVLADPERRREWLGMALADLASWRRSYGSLTELRSLFATIDRALAKRKSEAA